MTELSATIRLRPTRIGFLVHPADMGSVRTIMRACACLWGGVYNPIIPVFRTPPREWRSALRERVKGPAIAKGYIEYFEPDVFIESKSGLLEQAGLGALREKYIAEKQVLSLEEFLAPEDHRDWSEPAFGLNINDAFHHIYKTEKRFQSKHETEAVLVKPERNNALVEAVFGVYPQQPSTSYILKNYKDVFEAKELRASIESWIKVFKNGAITPLRATRYEIEPQRSWHHDPVIFAFDPKKSTDLIDLWNLRLDPRPILPVPLNWFEGLLDFLRSFIATEYRPVKGNPSGIMHDTTLEFARSISKDRAGTLAKLLNKDIPKGSVVVKPWRTRVWVRHVEDRIIRDRKLELVSKERRLRLEVKEEDSDLVAPFETLSPDFASRFGGHNSRWTNVVKISAFGPDKIATVFPFNTFDRRWPRLGRTSDHVVVGSEGWAFGQIYKNWNESIWLLTKEAAVIGSLKRLGIEAKLSDPGHIAKQMLDHLGGLWGVRLLANSETLQLLNKMAGGVRKKINGIEMIEETFERRSASVKEWVSICERRKEQTLWSHLKLEDFTKRNIIRLGLETDCPHCQATNWHSLTAADYKVTCERCLNIYEFPQARLKDQNRNWRYRVVGPFSVPDYGRGSYSALLTLRALETLSAGRDEMTFSTAMNLKFDEIDAEADLIALRQKEIDGGLNSPDIIIGETKSFGQGDLIKPKDLSKLKAICEKIPGALVVLSVMRSQFTATEKKLLQRFVRWGRRPDQHGRASNPVMLLTAHELFSDSRIGETWKELGKPHSEFTDYEHSRNLHNFADATQRIYLGLPSLYEERAERWRKRSVRKKRGARQN